MTPERRSELLISGCFVITALAAGALAAVYWRGGQPQAEGVLLFAAFGGLAAGAILLGHRLLPGGRVEERHELDSPADVDRAVDVELGAGDLSRRHVIVRTFTLAVGAMAAAAVFPIRSLGPRPHGALAHTSWRRGSRLVTHDGTLVRTTDVPRDSLVTVFPEGHAGSADAQAVLVRVDPALLTPRAGREEWSPDGLLAYSKVCTHAGCPVGLYEADRHELLCPCHQSSFDVLQHAKPTFGPAAVALPQLPLAIGEDGVLEARGDFSDPVGPAYWHHT